MNSLTKELELTLGPGTGELQLRCGLNSGAVTAGVLRGEKSRFQLFGDTVNTAARMETNGLPNRIHVSQTTADQILQAGKQDWLTAREDLVEAKGKGKMQTYWVEPTTTAGGAKSGTSRSGASVASGDSVGEVSGSLDDGGDVMESQQPFGSINVTIEGMIQLNTKILESLIIKVLAHRRSLASGHPHQYQPDTVSPCKKESNSRCVRDEVVWSIPMPTFPKQPIDDPAAKASSIRLEAHVREQLRNFISVIASMYRANNPFHNFDHATHVTMSTRKLLQRIIIVDDQSSSSITTSPPPPTTLAQQQAQEEELNSHSSFLCAAFSDPLTQLAVVFSALIHDVDHRGVSNPTLTQEDPTLAQRYQYMSIAEQNSVDLAWNVFMGAEFTDLRNCMFVAREDLQRFRQLVVNSVMVRGVSSFFFFAVLLFGVS
jgi:hypothetical protein